MTSLKHFRNALLLCAAFAACIYATALSDKAASMQPGTWSEFTTSGWTNALITTGVDKILNYANSAVWDSIKREVRFVGQGHMEAEKMIIYKESTNSWANASPPGGGGIGHGYDHNDHEPALEPDDLRLPGILSGNELPDLHGRQFLLQARGPYLDPGERERADHGRVSQRFRIQHHGQSGLFRRGQWFQGPL
jgi:hypothetical protein